MEKVTFAIVGTGIVGERIINQLVSNESATIIALFDENKTRLSEMANTYGLIAASSYEEILSLKPDWVYIGTPPVSHAVLSEKAIAAGLNVLCEKPLAHDALDGEVMAKAAVESDVHTAMHFPLMYKPSVRHMMHLVEEGVIGDVVRIELCTYFPHWPRLWQQNPWIGSREQGGFTREVFPHYFQLMYRMFGEISITDHETVYPKNELLAETGVLAIGKTEKQIPVLLNGLTGIGQKEELSYTVYGTGGVLKLRNWSELSIAQKDSPFETLTSFETVKTLVDECVLATQKEEALLVPFAEGLKVQKLIDHLLA
ncbi:Gfo/Idh/MocA family protein [Sporosarcina sp. G11-34]|uniref:Gfo/Idh/MocA family protein n=1 Tax=Sporosarcina sp. G11-34 TaxID=2849605 RepID=UPI0022A9BBF0|nr:Gfo/Idh/MocA family oxidoreductase [Sporosarcina sp. G11-34]MCZ2258959.1 Gfo/Idh/MocA family oxidoreductase [Sporosarcina sp. G11-34]